MHLKLFAKSHYTTEEEEEEDFFFLIEQLDLQQMWQILVFHNINIEQVQERKERTIKINT